MDSPELSVAASGIACPGVQHGRVVTDDPVTHVPSEPQADSVVVEQLGDNVNNLLVIIG
jgi:hypothetical protein